MPKHEPQRSCLGCRTARDKADLVRFVLSPEREIVPDLLSKLPGRGAYTCRTVECLRDAVSRKQFNRAFKGEVAKVSADELHAKILHIAEERIASYLALANKAGQVISGTDMVMEALRKQQAGIVLFARDVSADIGDKIRYAATRAGVEQIELLEKDRLGQLLGKGLRSSAAIVKGGFAETVIKEMRKYRNFFEGGAQVR